MTFKTALLGSAAAMFTVAGAQAADLKVAKPVDYVKVCDAFGTGYWYSPGTDWCLKLGGMIRFDVDIANNIAGANAGGTGDDHRFQTEYELYFTAKRMTEYGPLTAYIELYGDTGGVGNGLSSTGTGVDGTTAFNEGYVSIGPVLAGYTASILNQASAGTIAGHFFDAASDVDQLRLTFALGGWTLAIAAEDYRDRIGQAGGTVTGAGVPTAYLTALSLTGYTAGTGATGSMPDIVAALTGKIGPNATLHVGGGFGDRMTGTVWGAVADVSFDLSKAIAAGDKLSLGVAYSNGGGDFVDLASSTPGSYWTLMGAFTHFWTPGKLSTTLAASWTNTPVFDVVHYTGNITYTVTKGLTLAGEVAHADFTGGSGTPSATYGVVRLQANY